MRTFLIPVTWEVYGAVEVQANNAIEALELAHDIERKEGFFLPEESHYIDGSFEINNDLELVELINGLED